MQSVQSSVQQPNFGAPMGSPQPVFGQTQLGHAMPSTGSPIKLGAGFGAPSATVAISHLPNPGDDHVHQATQATQTAQPMIPFSGSPVSNQMALEHHVATTSNTLVPHSAPKQAETVKTTVAIDDINMTTKVMEVVVYRGGQMVRGQDNRMLMVNYNNPVAVKVSAPERKTVKTNRAKVAKPGVETKETDSKAKDPNYWLTAIQYNYGTEEKPQWRKGLTYTFGQRNPVWFSPVAIEEDEFEQTEEDGKKVTTKEVSYKTSCRLSKSTPQGQKILDFYDHLRVTLALALKSPANGSPSADTIGLAEMDPNAPKDLEIRRLYNQRMDNGVPDPTADPTKYIKIGSFKGKITASFVRPVMVNELMLHKVGKQYYLLDNRIKAFFACDMEGRFTQIDPSTQAPTPIPVSTFPHGTVEPEYTTMDPLELKNLEFLGIPIFAMSGFYTSGGKASAQEKLTGMIVLNTRESQRGAQVKELGGTLDFTTSDIDFADVAARFAALGIGNQEAAAPALIPSVLPPANGAVPPTSAQSLDSFTAGFN